MSIRPFNLPEDLTLLLEITPPSFQYPDNPEWSLAGDEIDELNETVLNLKRLWPIISIMQRIVPALGDILRGFVWEEEGQPVGSLMVQRIGTTQRWMVTNVSILPAFRRRGLASQLVQAGLELIRARNGKTAILDVIDRNLPAYNLYKKIGFEHFSGSVELQIFCSNPVPEPDLPANLVSAQFDLFDWRPRYNLAKEITPERIRQFDPVQPGSFQQPGMMRLLYPLIMRAQGKHTEGFSLQHGTEFIGYGRAELRKRAGGFNFLSGRLTPGRPLAAAYLVQMLLSRASNLAPDRRSLLALPDWQTDLIEAAETAGFEQRIRYHRLGMTL